MLLKFALLFKQLIGFLSCLMEQLISSVELCLGIIVCVPISISKKSLDEISGISMLHKTTAMFFIELLCPIRKLH